LIPTSGQRSTVLTRRSQIRALKKKLEAETVEGELSEEAG